MRLFIRLSLLLLLTFAFFAIHFFNGSSSAQQDTANSPAGAATCIAPPPGMVAWWPGEGNANDIRGENNGTLQGGVSFTIGKVDESFSFDGSSGFINVANTPALDVGTGDLTIDSWINFNSLAKDQDIFAKILGSFPNDQSYVLEFDTPNSLRFVISDHASRNDLVVPTSLQTGTWYHIAAVRQGNTNSLYLDGNLIGQQTAGNNIDTGTGGLATIGKLPTAGERFMSGSIDELEIFSRALTQTEIQNIFNAGSLGKCKPRCTSAPSGLVSWYDGDDDPFDRQGTNHGSLQGGATFGNGKVGRAFSLNGTDAFIQLPRDPTLDPTAAGSLDAWVKFNQLPSAADHVMEIVGTDSTTAGNDFDLEADVSNKFIFSIDDGETATSTTLIQTGVWYHVAGTWDSAGLTVYVN